MWVAQGWFYFGDGLMLSFEVQVPRLCTSPWVG